MTQTVLNNTNYSNKSTNKLGTIGVFGKSKFTSEQITERLKEHARAITLGTITMHQIVELWKTKFNIDISIPTEKEFRARNREKIEKVALEMIENGELAVPSLGADAVQAAIVGKLMVSKTLVAKLQKSFSQVLDKMLESKGASAGPSGVLTKSVINPKYKSGKGVKRIKKPIGGLELDAIVKMYKTLTDDYRADLSLVVEASKVRKLSDKLINKEAEKKFETLKEKLTETQFDPNQEVTEEMRQQYESTEAD